MYRSIYLSIYQVITNSNQKVSFLVLHQISLLIFFQRSAKLPSRCICVCCCINHFSFWSSFWPWLIFRFVSISVFIKGILGEKISKIREFWICSRQPCRHHSVSVSKSSKCSVKAEKFTWLDTRHPLFGSRCQSSTWLSRKVVQITQQKLCSSEGNKSLPGVSVGTCRFGWKVLKMEFGEEPLKISGGRRRRKRNREMKGWRAGKKERKKSNNGSRKEWNVYLASQTC